MKRIVSALLIFISLTGLSQQPAVVYPVDDASVEHAGVPKGEVLKFSFNHSQVFPGTTRDYWLYIPAQYRPGTPACVYINQDGIQWKAPVVFDNLINSGEMPVTIGVFITPGKIPAPDPAAGQDRFNRSFEYDGLGNAYGRFLLTELLPDAELQHATDGRPVRLSKNGNDRAIGGSSSGAVCAFTAAWEFPDQFSKVFSAIGTYVNLRGADRYPSLIRKYEPKPIKVFLQDGENDLNIYGGDWFKANEMMERALKFAGYQVEHHWGTEGHNGNQGTALFPGAMRWLWKGWPAALQTGKTANQVLADILIPGEDWQLVGKGYGFTEGIAADARGDVFFQDIPNAKTYKVNADGTATALPIDSKKASGTSFGSDGRRYVVAGGTRQVLSYDGAGHERVLADSINGNDIVVAANGNIYATAPEGSTNPGKIYLIRPSGEKLLVDQGIKFPNGITLTPDQQQVLITESASHWIWIYSILPGGTLGNKQKYGWLQVPDTEENAWPDGLKADTAGRIYTASRLGIQVLDQLGRVNALLPIPPSNGQASNCCFGGPGFDIFYVTCGDRVYRRKLRTRGANTFDPPHRPASPHL